MIFMPPATPFCISNEQNESTLKCISVTRKYIRESILGIEAGT